MKPFRSQITLTACLILMLIWTSNTGYAQNSQTLIAKTKSPNYKHNFKHKIRRSARLGNDLDNLSQPSKDEEINLIKDRLKFEMLTGGKWVTLDSSSSQIETTNQPLRISYVPLKDSITPEKVNLIFQKYTSKLNIQEEHATLTFKLTTFPSLKNDDDSSTLSSEVISRLPAGMYGITIAPNDPKKTIDFWLKATDVPPEPPMISSVDERLAREHGSLSLKLKNVVVGDKIDIFVDGNFVDDQTINQANINTFVNFGKVLRPGTSTVIARLSRGNTTSDYSKSKKAISRLSAVTYRDVKIEQTDFENTSATNPESEEVRVQSNIPFELVTKNERAEKAKANCVTPDELKNQLNELRSSLKNEMTTIFDNQLSPLNRKTETLESKFEDYKQQLSDHSNETKRTLQQIQSDLKILKKWTKYQNSGWREAPVFSWPTKKQVLDSYQKDLKNFQVLTAKDGKPITFDKMISDSIIKKCKASNEFTFDITFKAMDPKYATNQLMRIISLSKDKNDRNFTLGQFGKELVFRLRSGNTDAADKNGLKNIHDGNQGIHFYKDIKPDKIYNVVISYSNQKLRFWVNGKEVLADSKLTFHNGLSVWTNDCQLILGNEFGVKDEDRKWRSEIHSVSIRNVKVKLPKPDSDCLELLSVSEKTKPSVLVSAPPSINQTDTLENPENTTTGDSALVTSTDQFPLEDNENNLISVREFAFPYPASFPINRFGRYGKSFESEGAVLDRMHIFIAEDGKFKLIYDVRTTVRAEIDLQLQVKLKNGAWYPITLPKQTIYPPETNPSNSSAPIDAANNTKIINGYSSLFAARSSKIQDIRRRGTAVFGTRPVDSSY